MDGWMDIYIYIYKTSLGQNESSQCPHGVNVESRL